MLDGRRKSIQPMAQRLGEVHDQALFLPESWDDAAMATRRAACHLPAAVHHQPKWRLVLDMLDELAGWELSPRWDTPPVAHGERATDRLGKRVGSSPR